MPGVFEKFLRFGEGKKLKVLAEKVATVTAWEPEISSLSDQELAAKTDEFKKRLAEGETLEELLPETFAVVREGAKRTLNMRHFDVQIMGGIVLHEGKIAEMKTGEGKTLVATLPVYLNALEGKGVHVVTVNDYLAKRDTQWMGPVYQFLGLSISVLQHESSFLYDPDFASADKSLESLRPVDRRQAYQADITYGTNNEFGFDYLRDNMAMSAEEQVQRGYNYAIVDEVDSILIDEARTPLIISGAPEHAAKDYLSFAKIIPKLKKEDDYKVDEKDKVVTYTDEGLVKVEHMLGLKNIHEDVNLFRYVDYHLTRALRAQTLFKRDVDYMIKDTEEGREVIIIDEFTGRLMFGRRYSEGLHQAIEAKEGVQVREESQTLATISLQNYFRMYEKLAGMTGTAATEADEFMHIYKLDTVIIPPNMPMIRDDMPDVVYKTEDAKFHALVDDIIERHQRGQPLLVGTISIEKSEKLSNMLRRQGIPHQVLNAKYHEKEAEIIAQAGGSGTVTVATNMAGRGVDIVLGGNPPDSDNAKKVIEAGGLHVVGTERHEARRIDNQLRGRSGRQGDPGSSHFWLSLEDDLMRIFGGERISHIMDRLQFPEDQPIEANIVTKSIETAQKQVESQNFEIRKHLLEYDDVMNKQREVIYEQRKRCLTGGDLYEQIEDLFEDVFRGIVETYTNKQVYPDEWDWDGLFENVGQLFPLSWGKKDLEIAKVTQDDLAERLIESARQAYEFKEKTVGSELMRELERWIMLQVIDEKWREHLYDMDYLREGIGLRAIGQRDPLIEYKHEAFDMFQEMIESIKVDFLRFMFQVQITPEIAEAQLQAVGAENVPAPVVAAKPVTRSFGGQARGTAQSPKSGKVGRNDPCPCGAIDPSTGKPIKYKKCHGK